MARIAIVDDSEDVRDLLKEVLTEAGYAVTGLDGASDVVGDLARLAPDLIILDLMIHPGGAGLEGWDLVQTLRTHPATCSTPILVCSGDVVALREHEADFLRVPSLEPLAKPFSWSTLEEAVRRLVSAQRLPTWDDERDLVLIADANARLVHASGAMLAALGLRREDISGRRVADIVADGFEWTEREWRRYQRERRWRGRVTLRDTEGRLRPAIAEAEIVESGPASWHISHVQLVSEEATRPRAEERRRPRSR